NLELESEFVRGFGSFFFRTEVEEAGVVAIVRLVIEVNKPPINVLSVEQGLKLRVVLDPAIFADAQENDAVNYALDRKVQFVDIEGRIPHRHIAGKRVTPLLDLVQQ